MISIRSKYLGKFHHDLSEKYANSLNLNVYNIDEDFNLDKNEILKQINNSINSYEDHLRKYVKIDGENLSTKTIVKKLK